MKQRIQRFYQEHKTEIVLGASAIAVAMLVTAKKRQKDPIAGVDYWQRDDGMQMIEVGLKNGNSRCFIKPIAA